MNYFKEKYSLLKTENVSISLRSLGMQDYSELRILILDKDWKLIQLLMSKFYV